jgi:hypothetical protein
MKKKKTHLINSIKILILLKLFNELIAPQPNIENTGFKTVMVGIMCQSMRVYYTYNAWFRFIVV